MGTLANGGTGDDITLDGQAAFSGVTFVDSDSPSAGTPDLLVTAGNGRAGVTQGGDGGSLTNVGSQNAAFGTADVKVNELASALLQRFSKRMKSGRFAGESDQRRFA